MAINKLTVVFCALLLSLGVLGSGYSVGKAIYLFKRMSRIVTVKGIAEQDVKSDLGIWEINYRELGNDLVQLDQKIQHDQQIVATYLTQKGFAENEVMRTQMRIEDRLANSYQNNPLPANQQRYVVTAGLRIRSSKVDLISISSQNVDHLIQQGVPLTFDASNVSPNPSFYYTQLDAVRPTMLAEATHSAYKLAMQFAQDSDSNIAEIQRASQGVFQIMSRDTSTMNADWSSNQNALGSIDKKVRLVSTIDYRLK